MPLGNEEISKDIRPLALKLKWHTIPPTHLWTEKDMINIEAQVPTKSGRVIEVSFILDVGQALKWYSSKREPNYQELALHISFFVNMCLAYNDYTMRHIASKGVYSLLWREESKPWQYWTTPDICGSCLGGELVVSYEKFVPCWCQEYEEKL